MRTLTRVVATLALISACVRPAASGEWSTEERIDAWFAELRREAGTVDGLAALHRLVEHQETLDVTPRLVREARALLDRRDVHPLVEARLHEWLGTAADRRGDAEGARAHFAAVGAIADWATIGPYPSYGGAAMARLVGPEEPGCEEGCPLDGRPMTWIERPGIGAHGYVNLRACFEERTDVVAFLRTYVQASPDEPTAVALRAGGGDGLRIEVDGQTVIDDDARRTPQPDQVVAGAMLAPGWNEIRVKAGQEGGAWGLYLRLTTPDGHRLPHLETSAAPPDGWSRPAPAADTVVTVADPVAEAIAAGQVEGADAEALRRAVELMRITSVADRRDEDVARLLRRLLELRPDDPDLLLLLADESDEPEEQLQAIQRARSLAPDLADATLALHRYRRYHQDPREGLALVREALAADPASLAAGRALADELRGLGADEAALDVLDRLRERHPHAPTIVTMRAQILHGMGNAAAALAAYEEALEIADLATTRNRIGSLAREAGDADRALAQARRLAQQFPDGLIYRRAYARELWRADLREEAVAELTAILPRFPDAAKLRQELGQWNHRMGRDDLALDAWRESLAIRPRNPSLQQYLTDLEGGDDPMRARNRRDPTTLARTGGDVAMYADAAARVLLLNRAIQVFDNGSDQEYVQQVIRIDSEVGVRAFGAMSLPYDRERESLRVLTAEVIHPDGSTSRARSIHDDAAVSWSAGAYSQVYTKNISFEALDPGDVVHLEYKRESREQRNRFQDFFGAMIPLQSWVPTVEASVRITVPEGMPLYTGGVGYGEPDVTEEDGTRTLEFRLFDLPAMPAESNGPGYFEIGAYISASNFESWDQVAAWWADLAAPQFRLGDDGERQARELARGASDEREVVRRIYEHVLRTIRYVGLEFGIHGWKPYEARLVRERGYGDCKDKATLLVAMLDAVGIHAQPVLVQTVGAGHAGEYPANLHLFNHAIAYVPSLDLYLDGTAEYSPMESLRWDDQGALALRIHMDGSGGDLVTIPVSAPRDNLTTSDTVLEIAPDGSGRFHEHWTERGLLVAEIRRLYSDESARLQALEENYQGRLTGVRLTDLETRGFDDLGNLLEFDIRGELPVFVRRDGPDLAVPVTLFPDELGQNLVPQGEDGRRTDVVLQLPHAVELSTTVIPPPGMTVGSLPEPVHLEHPRATYDQEVTVEDGAAVVHIHLTYLDRRIPIDEYAAFRSFCLAVDRAQDRAIVLSPAEGSP